MSPLYILEYLGILGQKQLIGHNLSLQHLLKVIDVSLEAYEWDASKKSSTTLRSGGKLKLWQISCFWPNPQNREILPRPPIFENFQIFWFREMHLTHMLPKRPQPSLEVVANSNYGKFRVFEPNLQKQGILPQTPNFWKFSDFLI